MKTQQFEKWNFLSKKQLTLIALVGSGATVLGLLLHYYFNVRKSTRSRPEINEEKVLSVNLEFPVPGNLLWQKDADEKKIWQKPNFTSVEEISKQAIVQIATLKKLAISNYLAYFMPVINLENKEDFLKVRRNAEQDSVELTQQSYQILSKYLKSEGIESSFDRFIHKNVSTDIKIDLAIPKYLYRKFLEPLFMKQGYNFRIYILVSKNFSLSPASSKNYAIAIVDCEHPEFQSHLLGCYIQNLAASLQNYKDSNPDIAGTTLILKGRIPGEALTWVRGQLPFEPSVVPDVEVVYGIPVSNDSLEEFFFTLKKGSTIRLSKNNKELSSPVAKKFYADWQDIRSYVVIDELIRHAKNNTTDYRSFINKFWQEFSRIKIPNRETPDWKIFKGNPDIKNDQSLVIIRAQIEKYKEQIEQEKKSSNLPAKNKAIRLKINLENYSRLDEAVLANLRNIALKIDNEKSLFYLDWNHIIYDTIKNKKYNKVFDDFSKITPQKLDELNFQGIVQKGSCFIRVSDSKSSIQLSASEVPKFIKCLRRQNETIFNFILFDILFICIQLNVTSADIKKYFDQILVKIEKNAFASFYHFQKKLPNNEMEQKDRRPDMGSSTSSADSDLNLAETYRELMQVVTAQQKAKIPEFLNALKESLDESCQERKKPAVKEEDTNAGNAPTGKSDFLITSIFEIIQLLKNTPIIGTISLVNILAILSEYKSAEVYQVSKENNILNELLLHPLNVVGNEKFLYFFNIFLTAINTVKYIYAIDKEENVRVAHEQIVSDNLGHVDRPTHSELTGGGGVLAAGEIIFVKDDKHWRLDSINNGSGHYRPPAHLALPVSKEIILRKKNPDISVLSSLSVLNCLKPGMTLASGWEDGDSDDNAEQSPGLA